MSATEVKCNICTAVFITEYEYSECRTSPVWWPIQDDIRGLWGIMSW